MCLISEGCSVSETNTFHNRCEALFAQKLGYGRRWKTAAAQALGIGRATLYRYFDDDSGVPQDVLVRLKRLDAGEQPIRDDHQMLRMLARGLLDVQRQIDKHGWLKEGYPSTLQRSFDLAAARNALEGEPRWPTDFGALSRLAQKSLYDWGVDVSWDPDGEFVAATLIEGGEITPACIGLAMPGQDPEAELIENVGYKLLKDICRERRDGQAIYVGFRRAVIENPVLTSWTTTILTDPLLASVERLDEIVYAFYQKVPEAMVVADGLPICSVSGTILRRDGTGFHTECRNPEAVRRARAGDCKRLKWHPGMMHLHRPFRLYWCLPGQTELELAERLQGAGWAVDLWPDLDRVDIAATSSDGCRRIAADVKEYLSPENLASRFEGFKEYAADHECFLVVPDYMPELSKRYEDRFQAVRASRSKAPMALQTVSGLLDELEVA